MLYSWFLVLIACVSLSEGKTSRGELHENLDSHAPGWWYLDKFAWGVGRNPLTLELDVAIRDEQDLIEGAVLGLYVDDDWPRVLAARTCEEKMALTRGQVLLENFRHDAPDYDNLRVKLTHTQTMINSIRTHYWYVAWIECGTRDHPAQHFKDKVYYTLTMQQEGGSHTSADNAGMLQSYAVTLAAFALGSMHYYRQLVHTFKNSHTVPMGVYLLALAMLTQIVSVVAEVAHLLIFAANGSGVWFLEFVGEICCVLSQVSLTRYFMTYAKAAEGSAGTVLTGILLLVYLPLAFMLTVGDQEGHDEYHDHHGFARYTLYLMRLCMCGWFWLGMGDAMAKVKYDPERSANLQIIGAGATSWFVMPIVLLFFSHLFAFYNQHFFTTTSTLLLHSLVVFCFAQLSLKESMGMEQTHQRKYF